MVNDSDRRRQRQPVVRAAPPSRRRRTRTRTSVCTSTARADPSRPTFAVYDTMQIIRPRRLHRLPRYGGVGRRRAPRRRGRRQALQPCPTARVLIHQPPRRGSGSVHRHREPGPGDGLSAGPGMRPIIAHHTGQTVERVARDTERTTSSGATTPCTTGSSTRYPHAPRRGRPLAPPPPTAPPGWARGRVDQHVGRLGRVPHPQVPPCDLFAGATKGLFHP